MQENRVSLHILREDANVFHYTFYDMMRIRFTTHFRGSNLFPNYNEFFDSFKWERHFSLTILHIAKELVFY